MLQNFIPAPDLTTYFTDRHTNTDELFKHELNPQHTVQMEQVHGNHLEIIEQLPKSLKLPQTDAMLTTLKNVNLMVRVADCVPILLYHPLPLIGVIHAGRKGTRQHIVKRTLELLKNKWDIQNNLTIWLGPRICPKCYQIDRETDEHYDLITENRRQIWEVFQPHQVNILDAETCTAHQNETYYSYRKEGSGTRMNYGIIRLDK